MVEVQAPGKLNLGLNVLRVREDGYHILDTVFVMVDIFDTIKLKERIDNRITIACSHPSVPVDSRNIVWKAVRKMQALFGIYKGVDIEIEKNIPVGGGMAGGSADAAAVLRALPYLWKVKASYESINNLACELGADVPYCYSGGIQRGEGIGSKLTKINSKCNWSFAVLPQPWEISTLKVFKKWDEFKEKIKINIFEIEKALVNCDNKLLCAVLGNSLEKAVINLQPQLMELLSELRASNLTAQITGSGSTIYVVLNGYNDIMELQKKYHGEILQCNLLTSLPDVKSYTK